jgi:adenylate cyclase
MGDNVNLTSRLEDLNKTYETTIIISENTYDRVKGDIACRELDLVRVRGKTIPVKIYEMIGKKGDHPDEEEAAALFERGLTAVRQRQWEEALAVFEEMKKIHPDDAPTALYLERIAAALINPPLADWDGVF